MQIESTKFAQAIMLGKNGGQVTFMSVKQPQFKGTTMFFDKGMLTIKHKESTILVFTTNIAFMCPLEEEVSTQEIAPVELTKKVKVTKSKGMIN